MTPHLQESTLVDTCLQYQISTTDFQVNLLCSSKETSIFEYVNLLSGKPLTKFNQLILEAALHWTTLVECNSLGAQRPTAPGWTAPRRIHSIQRLTLYCYFNYRWWQQRTVRQSREYNRKGRLEPRQIAFGLLVRPPWFSLYSRHDPWMPVIPSCLPCCAAPFVNAIF